MQQLRVNSGGAAPLPRVATVSGVAAWKARQGPLRPHPPAAAAPTLGQLLLDAGAVTAGDLLKALVIQRREDASLAEVLVSNGWVTEKALTEALARLHGAGLADLEGTRPDPRLIDRADPRRCLAEGVLPWREIGGVTLIATARPERFAAAEPWLRQEFGALHMVLAPEDIVTDALLAIRRHAMMRDAEVCVPEALSCRSQNARRTGDIALVVIALLAAGFVLAPVATLAVLTGLAALNLLAATVLRVLAFQAWLAGRRAAKAEAQQLAEVARAPAEVGKLPVITVMVALFKEADIAPRLVARIAALTYPRELTDILLVIEEEDDITREALAAAKLPPWMRVVRVPAGRVQTKPRALNYAMNFARGSIVGIWDAEDIPDPEQLHKAARHFASAPPEVVCVQGVLDFYEPATNWLSRCFTIEYGNWFRAILPGIARLGLFVPLGGTTLFMRREAIDEVGGWDAWNVTEDADLGLRLARFGYRTEMLDSVTMEEPNTRARTWIKQRSRWHKGYFMTWATHMRAPRQLWREIGAKAFLGLQLQMFGTVVGFLIAPLLWTYLLLSFGLSHPVAPGLQSFAWGWAAPILFTLFVASELIALAVGVAVHRQHGKRFLLGWLPTMALYFPLATFAAWKAIYEVVVDPFSWDKTAHGVIGHSGEAAAAAASAVAAPGEVAADAMQPVAVIGSIR